MPNLNNLPPVEKGIPAPETSGSGNRSNHAHHTKYGFGRLAPGDSMLVKTDNISRVRSSMAAFTRNHPEFRLTGRQVEGGLRVWRLP